MDTTTRPNAASTIDVAAPPERVYDIVADVTGIGRWAAETTACQWIGGATEAAVGARFRGRNQKGRMKWSTTCEVVAADPGRRFAFDVRVGPVRSARWEYLIEPTDEGCRVTELTTRFAPDLPTALVAKAMRVGHRDAHNQRNIEQTLAQLKAFAEGS